MSNSSILVLNQVISGITLYVPYFTIVIGTLGSLFNLLIFTSKQLRNNACGLYFLCSTIFDLISLMFGGLTRLMIDHYPYLLPLRSIIFCKIRTYLSVAATVLATFFLSLASIDRCLVTSHSRKWRNLSKIKIAQYISTISIIFWLLFYSHMLVYFDLRLININTNTYVCAPKLGPYTTFISIIFLACNTVFFYTIMFIGGIITLTRVRTSRNRVGILFNRRIGLHRLDRHLITIMFFQVGIGVLLTSFRCIFLSYSLLTSSITKDIYRMTIESFLDQFSLTVYSMNYAKSFYVNILTSPLFRDIFIQRIMFIWHLLKRRDFY